MTAPPGDDKTWILHLLQHEELQDEHRREMSELLLSLLEVMDSFDRVLGHDRSAGEHTHGNGCRLIARHLGAVLDRMKVRRMQVMGLPVDIDSHEVVGVRPTGPEQVDVIVEVVRQGYEWDDRLLRAAQVVVGRCDEESSA